MSQINFLPPSYLQRHVGRRRVLRQALLLAIAAACIGGWYAASRGGLAELELHARSLEAQVLAGRERVAEIGRLETRRLTLDRRVRMHRELAPSLDSGAVVIAITELMPPSLALSELLLEGKRPTPAAAGAAANAAPAREGETLRVTVIGVAPADTEIADFVGKVSDSPLFINVKMLYSRSVQAGDYLAREFRIEMEVPLDREYRPTPAAREVAYAG